jgi:hypothetical protein
MRSDFALELFAHDREDLAWLVAEASTERIAQLEAAITADLGNPWPRSDRWITAAIRALDGTVPEAIPGRTRSPVLEMPALLRHRAHRNDVADGIAEGLRRVQRTRAGWGFLVVESWSSPFHRPSPFYVQFASYPGPGVRGEAVGNENLPQASELDDDGEARMRALGWEPGTGAISDVNWIRQFDHVRRLDRQATADFALTTLEDVFGCGPGTQFRWTVHVWPPGSLGETAEGPLGPRRVQPWPA